jgi:exodeoxyribonuclease VII small subunit
MTSRNDGDARPDARSFEQILDALERVVRELEGEGLPLETALAKFEEGVALAREGSQRLESAERRIEEILDDGRIAALEKEEQ